MTNEAIKSGKTTLCKRCGRKLKTEEAIERGMGKTCWEKSRTSLDKKPLFRSVPNAESNTRIPK